MALWKDLALKDSAPAEKPDPVALAARSRPEPVPPPAEFALRSRQEMKDLKESVLAAGLTFEGKIEGSGHVRISGRFKGDVHIDGTLTIEPGAQLGGSVRAGSVIVAGQLEGNIEAAQRVELQPTGVVTGDVAAGSLTVAAGARMRGRAEFGWSEDGSPRPAERK